MWKQTKVLRQILAAALIFGFASLALTGCDLFEKDEEGTTNNPTAITFVSVTANGSSLQTTTELTLSFSAPITGLSAADITLSGVGNVNKGTLAGSNPYTLPISGLTAGGNLSVAVAKTGFAISGTPKTVTIYYVTPLTEVTFVSVTANGSASQSTTELTLSFSAPIAGLSAADITLNGINGVIKGSLTGSNPYTLPISSFTASGTLTVAVAKAGFTISGSSKTVAIYYTAPITAATLASYLATLPVNNASSPHNIAIKVSSVDEFEIIRIALWEASNKYVKLDLSSSTVTIIENIAFRGCTSLVSVIIPNSAISIGREAFAECDSLTSVTILNGVTSIGTGAFIGCESLISVTIPDSVTSIGGYAFTGCESLVSVTIPGSVNSIEMYTFDECISLADVTISSGVTKIERRAFSYCIFTSITLPNSITILENEAFLGCRSLVSVTIPDSVTDIQINAFGDCDSLTAINVNSGNNEYTSENGVLYSKDKKIILSYPQGKKDASFTIPNNVTSIRQSAFQGCISLVSVIIPNSVTNIGDNAFYNCFNLTIINIPSSVISIGGEAFYNCISIASVSIGSSVISIGNGAFGGCVNVSSIIIPHSVTSIGSYAFRRTKITSITIPDSVTSIGWNVFEDCTSLASVSLGSGITAIDSGAFSGCTSLASITIPNGITVIGSGAFSGCSSLNSVTFQGLIPSTGFVNIINSPAFPGDLRTKYYATGGGIGTYTRPSGDTTWTKQ